MSEAAAQLRAVPDAPDQESADHGWFYHNTANLITLVRGPGAVFCFIQVYHLMIIGNPAIATLWLLGAGFWAAMDIVDGKIARKRGTETELGKNLDRIMDKATCLTGLWCFYQLLRVDHGSRLNISLLVLATMIIIPVVVIELGLMTLPGSSGPYGKRKFWWQAGALTLGYFSLLWAGPWRYGIAVILLSYCLLPAICLGILSFTTHLHEAKVARIQARRSTFRVVR